MLLALLVALASPRLFVADESLKVRPQSNPATLGPARIELAAAGGECIGAQIVVAGPAARLTASAAPLTARGSRAVPVQLSRVGTVELSNPSGPDGEAGEWPDPLIPERDALYGEARRAFPVDVPAGRLQSIFVEVCPERGQGRRTLTGAVRVAWNGGAAQVPVSLRVRGFDLPATPALHTAFGFSGYSAAKGHGRGPEANRELTRAYDELALRRGITLFGGTQDAPAHQFEGDSVRIDWKAYDAEVAPFLDGTALPSGARWTAVELRMPAKLTRAQRRAWRRAWVEHFRARGWLDRLFVYVQDEPAPQKLGEVEEKAAEVRADAPGVRRLVTTAYSPKLGSVDFFVPLLNCFEATGPTCPRGAPRSAYPSVWWYQSCMSHGCGWDGKPVLHPAFTGWPSYMIDAPATAARTMGVLAFAQRIEGELYFDTDFAYDQGDPWRSQWAFGGNGDGTLFYPGTPARIGGVHDVPVESLRLVQIARGLADHAYLSLLAQAGDPALAAQEARALAPGIRLWEREPRRYAAMRERVAKAIEARLAAGVELGAR